MRKLILAATALAFASPVAAIAAPTISVVGGVGPIAIGSIGFNNFKTELNGAGFVDYKTSASLFLTGMAKITYYYMGSESGFENIFSAGTSTYKETSHGYESKWLSPVLIGTQTYATGGSLAGLLGFTSGSVGGLPSPVGSDGFGIFLKKGQLTGYTTLYFGYDDERSRPDDNHDDYMVKAVITAVPVPEPGTWAMLLTGFAVIGSLLRRRRNNGVSALA